MIFSIILYDRSFFLSSLTLLSLVEHGGKSAYTSGSLELIFHLVRQPMLSYICGKLSM